MLRHVAVDEIEHGPGRPRRDVAVSPSAQRHGAVGKASPVDHLPRASSMGSHAAPLRAHVVPENHPAFSATYVTCSRPSSSCSPSSQPARCVELSVNCFRVTLRRNGPREFFKYDVSAVDAGGEPTAAGNGTTTGDAPPPRALPKRLMRAIVGELLLQNQHVFRCVRAVHDGMAGLYAPQRLGEWNEMTFTGVALGTNTGQRRGGRGGSFDVTLKLVESIDVTQLRDAATISHQAIQAIDVVLRHLGSQRCLSIGSNLYNVKKPKQLDGTKELNSGMYQAVRVGRPQLFLNMDTVASVFYAPGPLIDLMLELARVRDVPDLMRYRDRWARAIQRLDVRFTHRTAAPAQTIRAVGEHGADRTMIPPRRGGADSDTVGMSVAAYFFERYQIRLRYPQLPVVNVGSVRRPTWLPPELCEIAPGHRCRDMQHVDTAAIIRHCCVKPAQRKQSIEDGLRDAAFENDPFKEAFGLEISPRMERVAARSLNPPELHVKDHVVLPKHGGWNLSQYQYYRARRLCAWYVVNLSSSHPQAVERFIGRLVEEMKRCGIDVRDGAPLIVGASRGGHGAHDIEGLMREGYDRAIRRSGGDFLDLVVVIKERQGPDYADIKRVSDALLGVPSQCLLAKNVMRANGQYLGNVALKINLKLRGVNFALYRPLRILSRGTTIVFGADVEYPRSRRQPAIAAVVASMDASAASFVGRVSPQSSSGLSTVLPTILWELFLKFEERAGARPERIIFFRDGTSEGRMDDIFQAEMKAIHYAWMKLAGPNAHTPPVTFVVVTRRHHLRAFPCSPRDADRSGNPPAGTVIDQTVVDPARFDFYLYGHSGLLGTSRPAHYTVLRNDNDLGEKDMEELCFDLCHMFGTSTRSVSIVAPIYYAKILAARARCLLDFRTHDGTSADAASTDSDNSSSNSANGIFPGEPVIDVHRFVRNSLFFV